jgi:hypothetical protein
VISQGLGEFAFLEIAVAPAKRRAAALSAAVEPATSLTGNRLRLARPTRARFSAAAFGHQGCPTISKKPRRFALKGPTGSKGLSQQLRSRPTLNTQTALRERNGLEGTRNYGGRLVAPSAALVLQPARRPAVALFARGGVRSRRAASRHWRRLQARNWPGRAVIRTTTRRAAVVVPLKGGTTTAAAAHGICRTTACRSRISTAKADRTVVYSRYWP